MERALTLEEFGTKLLQTQDLDPVYVALHRVQLPSAQLRRLCLAYWCFYHLGAAAKLSEASGSKFWDLMREAAVNAGTPKPWPRGAERRHFRGQQAVDAVAALVDRYKAPEGFVDYVLHPADGARPTFGGVTARVQEHRGFGPWIAFKIADMGERIFGAPVDFSNCEFGVYKDPRQGAALARVERGEASHHDANKPWLYPISDYEVREEFAHWTKHFRKAKAPPQLDRPVGVQEIETIFCKYKSYRKGSYPPGKDTKELHHALQGWGPTAENLRRNLPEPDHGKATQDADGVRVRSSKSR